MDDPMNGVVEEDAHPEAEIRDIPFWLETITSKVQEIESATAEISSKIEDIETSKRTIASESQEIEAAIAEISNQVGAIEASRGTIAFKTQEIEAATAEISSKFGDIQASTSAIKQGMEQIARLNEEQEILNSRNEFETSLATSDESFEINEKTLSSTAKSIINDLQDGPLDPNTFLDFLTEKTFGKPRPPVLPILRGYITRQMVESLGTDQVVIAGICEQLKSFRDKLKQAHLEYKEEHRRKDVNLHKRIERLLENIKKESDAERRYGMRQSSIMGYMRPGN